MLRLITARELGRLRAVDAAEKEREAGVRAWVAAFQADPQAFEVLPPDPVPVVVQVHGAECRSSRITELEARCRRLQELMDQAMGYDAETDERLDKGATALWRDTVQW